MPPRTLEVPGKALKSSAAVRSQSVSSCASSSSSSSSQDSRPSTPIWRLKSSLSRLTPSTNKGPHLQNIETLPHPRKPEKSVLVVKSLFSPHEVESVESLMKSNSLVEEIRDRKGDLKYNHKAYRTEIPIRLSLPSLYDKILEVCNYASTTLWGGILHTDPTIHRRGGVYPEIEYIVYDDRAATDGSPPGFIEPHYDNHSVVTGICMLTRPGMDFRGGVNCFSGPGKGRYREFLLSMGDACIFRGESLEHWITPVEKGGLRRILQWELSRI